MRAITAREKFSLKGLVQRVDTGYWCLSDESGNSCEQEWVPSATIFFDVPGKIVKEVRHEPRWWKITPYTVIYTYDDDDRLKEIARYGADGALLDKTLSAYDESGNEVEQVRYKPDGSLYAKWISDYDTYGNKVSMIMYWRDGSVCSEWDYTYHEDGKLKQMVHYEYSGREKLDEKWVSIYDTKGRVIETTGYNAQGRICCGRYVISRDDDGNKIEVASYDSTESLRIRSFYTYEFDSVGNWIRQTKKTVFNREDAHEILSEVYRNILYY